MNVRTYRSKIQNSPVKKRRAIGTKKKSTGKSTRTASKAGGKSSSHSTGNRSVFNKTAPSRTRSPERKERKENTSTAGSKVLWMMVCAGVIVGAGFVYALQSQASGRDWSRKETKLKAVLDDISEKQRYEALRRQQTLSTTRSGQVAAESGLVQPKLNESAKPVISAPVHPVKKEIVKKEEVKKEPVKKEPVKKETVKKEVNKTQTNSKQKQTSKNVNTKIQREVKRKDKKEK